MLSAPTASFYKFLLGFTALLLVGVAGVIALNYLATPDEADTRETAGAAEVVPSGARGE